MKKLFFLSCFLISASCFGFEKSHEVYRTELMSDYHAVEASQRTISLVQKALEYIGFLRPVTIFQTESRNQTCAGQNIYNGELKEYLVLGTNDASEEVLEFDIYHEIGHLVHHDIAQATVKPEIIKSSVVSMALGVMLGRWCQKDFTNPDVLVRCKAAMIVSVIPILISQVYMWSMIIPKLQAKESRADAFACNHLLKQNKIKTVLCMIHTWLKEYEKGKAYDVFCNYLGDHPGSLQRAKMVISELGKYGYSIDSMPEDMDATVKIELQNLATQYIKK